MKKKEREREEREKKAPCQKHVHWDSDSSPLRSI